MYVPPSFRAEDPAVLDDFLSRYGFATLVSVRGGVPFATHLPLLLDRGRRVLCGHVARANPHWELFDGSEALAVFAGPHAYISPTWYATAPAVPTWNYAAVHVYGVPGVVGAARTREIVDETVAKYESGRPNPWPGELPDDFREKLLAAVVGFEMPLTRVEGKFKLGQNRSEADRAGVLAALQNGTPDDRALAAFAERWG